MLGTVDTPKIRRAGGGMLLILALMLLLIVAALLVHRYIVYAEDAAEAYVTAPVVRGNIATSIKATGTLNATVVVDVSSQISGRIAAVLVNFNDEVRAGQVIARIDPETYLARVNEAKAALRIAKTTVLVEQASLVRARASLANARAARGMVESQLEGLRARFANTEADLERKTALARAAVVADAELSRVRRQRDAEAADLRAAGEQLDIKIQEIAMAEADVRIVEANLSHAEGVVEQKQAVLEQAEVDLQRTEIRAPINGIVIKRSINPGQTVAVNLQAKTLLRIANDLREMVVYGMIDEADVGQLRTGQRVEFTVDAYPQRSFSGVILQIRKSPEIVQSVVTYTAVISAPNPDLLLLPGMTANLRITTDEAQGVLRIPNQALVFRPQAESARREQDLLPETGSRTGAARQNGSQNVSIVGDDGRALMLPVAVGRTDGIWTELRSGGLTEGQHVIVGTAGPSTQNGLLDSFFGREHSAAGAGTASAYAMPTRPDQAVPSTDTRAADEHGGKVSPEPDPTVSVTSTAGHEGVPGEVPAAAPPARTQVLPQDPAAPPPPTPTVAEQSRKGPEQAPEAGDQGVGDHPAQGADSTSVAAAPRQTDGHPPAAHRPPDKPAAGLTAIVRHGDAMLALGDIAAARLLYEHAAKDGSAEAATAAGKTYDPAFLAQIGAGSMGGDPAAAAIWYRRAVALGDHHAETWLNRLPPGHDQQSDPPRPGS